MTGELHSLKRFTKIIIDPKFIELTPDVVTIILYNMHTIILSIFLGPVRKEPNYEGKNKQQVKEDRIMYTPRLEPRGKKTNI